MSDRILAATRKGLLTLARGNGDWSVAATDFPGIAVTATLRDGRDGALYAVLKHGHFGTKLHRSDDDGRNWKEVAGDHWQLVNAHLPPIYAVRFA